MPATSIWPTLDASFGATKTTPALAAENGVAMTTQWFLAQGAEFFSYTLDYSESKLEQNVLNPANLQAKLELDATRKVT